MLEEHSKQSLTDNDGCGLQSLAKAHLVCQHAMQAAAAQERQPTDARPLVQPQLPMDLHRQLKLIHLRAHTTSSHAAPCQSDTLVHPGHASAVPRMPEEIGSCACRSSQTWSHRNSEISVNLVTEQS